MAAVIAAALVLAGCGSEPVSNRDILYTGSVPAPSTSATARTVTPPPAHAIFDYQLGGPYPPAANVRIVDRDYREQALSGRYNICYLNAFQTQPEQRSLWTGVNAALLLMRNGKPVEDPDWPGELLLDVSTAAKRTRIAAIEGAWIHECAAKGFQAVEPDNLDSYLRSHALLTQADDEAMARLLIARAHRDGLAIAQKNVAELGDRGRALGFDFAVTEDCQRFDECDAYTSAYGNEVIEIEYTDGGTKAFEQACQNQGQQISVILRDRDVAPAGSAGYRYRTC